MAAESNVGARIFLIGKDAALAGLKEINAAVATLNKQVAAGADASKVAAAGDDEQAAAIARMNLAMDTYKANLARTTLATDSLARVGKYAFFGLAAAGAAWGYESVKWAQSFQTALVQLQTQAGLSAKAVRSIGGAAMANAKTLGISPTTYLQTIYHPASAFGKSTKLTVATDEAITTQAARLAAIGTSNAETTTNALTGVMKSYNLRGKKAALKTAALLNAIIGAGNMHASTLVAALRSGVAATGKTFGVSPTALGGALAFMTDRGVPASQAGTHLRMTLSLLGAPSAEADTYLKAAGLTTKQIQSSTNSLSQMLQEAGVTSTQLSRALRTNKGAGGIYNAMELLHKSLTSQGLTAQMQSALITRSFGGGRMGSTIQMLYNSLSTLKTKSDKIQRKGTTSQFMKDWAKEQATLDFQLHKLGATIETLGTSFGKQLIPPLTKVVGLFSDLLSWLDKNKSVVYGLASMIGLVLVPAIGLYLYRALFKTGGAIRSVMQGYANLLQGNKSEQIALEQTRTQLTLTSGETENLAAKTTALGGAASTAAGQITLESGAEGANVGAADADAAAAFRLGGADTRLGIAATEGGVGADLGAAGIAGAEGASSGLFGIPMGVGLKSTLGSIAGKAGMGAMVAMMGTSLFNQYARKPLTGAVGKRGETDISDALTGAEMGLMFGPEGALVGGALGAAVGERGHLVQDAKDVEGWGHDARVAVQRGFDNVTHDVGGFFGDLFGEGSQPKTTHQRLVVRVDNHLYLDGKNVTKSTVRRVKKNAALAGS